MQLFRLAIIAMTLAGAWIAGPVAAQQTSDDMFMGATPFPTLPAPGKTELQFGEVSPQLDWSVWKKGAKPTPSFQSFYRDEPRASILYFVNKANVQNDFRWVMKVVESNPSILAKNNNFDEWSPSDSIYLKAFEQKPYFCLDKAGRIAGLSDGTSYVMERFLYVDDRRYTVSVVTNKGPDEAKALFDIAIRGLPPELRGIGEQEP